MKNLIALILGVFLFVALTEGFSVRMSGGGGSIASFQKEQPGSQQSGQLLRERRDGLADEKNRACNEGGDTQCEKVCESAGHSTGGCRGTSFCRCFD